MASNPFLAFLAEHGVKLSEQKAITGETGRLGNRMVPYFGPIFRRGGLPLDTLAQYAHERGFLTDAQFNSDLDNGGVNALTEMIRRTQAGERIDSATPVSEESEFERRAQAYHDAHAEAVDTLDTEATDDELGALVQEVTDENETATAADIDAALGLGPQGEDRGGAQETPALAAPLGDSGSRTPQRSAGTAEVDEARAEREATQAEAERIEPEIDYEEINSILRQVSEDADRSIQYEALDRILSEERREEEAGAREAQGARGQGSETSSPGAARDQADQGGEDVLSRPTEQGLKARADAALRRAKEKRERDAAPPPEEFTLAGSDRAVDQAAARGQMELAPADAAAAQSPSSPSNNLPAPSEAQRDAGNYLKPPARINGLTVRIENEAGTHRRPEWPALPAHYGYFERSESNDGDGVDVFVKPDTPQDFDGPVFIIDQMKQGGGFDEHKVMLGWKTQFGAVRAYKRAYTRGWKVGPITRMSMDEFKTWLREEDTTKPASQLTKPTGAWALAQRQQNAGERFIQAVTEQFGLTRGQAKAALDELVRLGEVKLNANIGQFELRDGRFWSAEVMRRAAHESSTKATRKEEKNEKIVDVGERIGGARKDLAAPTGQKGTKPADERPGWRKRYTVSQIAASSKPGEVGRWTIRDERQKDRLGQARQVGRDTFATNEDAEAAIPLVEVARNHRATPVSVDKGEPTVYEITRMVSDRKRVKVVDQQFATREAAMLYMAEHAVEIIETKTSFGEEILPAPEKVMREGPVRREGNATGEQFKDTFGFKAVEFGNWNSQDERQEVMNHAFDGLADLAEVLDIPTRAIGLNGDLALAFGSRGSGLTGARAHYEPDYSVINLTKMRGAGSLAHEWLHALDHYLGRQDGKASSERVKNRRGDTVFKTGTPEQDMATHGFKYRDSGVRQEVRDAYAAVVETMLKKAEQYVEDTQKADKFVGAARDDVRKHLERIRESLATKITYRTRKNEPASAEQLAEFDEIARRIVDGEAIETKVVPSGKSGIRWSNDALEALSKILKDVRGYSGFAAGNKGTLDALRGGMERYSQRLKLLAQAQSAEVKTKKVPTDFAMAAKSIDQGRASDYWSTPHEMAARAFQSYVLDKIAERGGTSDFLTYGAENLAVPTPWGWQRPFPAGAERKAINAAFDKLVATLQTRETGRGIALFSRSRQTRMPANSLVDTFEALHPDLFKYQKTTGKTLEKVADQIDPGFQIGALRKPTPEETEHGIESAQDIVSPNGAHGVVHYYPNGRIGADLSGFASGYSRGSAVGQMLSDLAFNTGRKFFGDPGRYSTDGQARFPEMLLSSALKHGTTRHLEIDARDAERFGIRWSDNDARNARQLIDLVRKNVRKAAPEVEALRYNFKHERFEYRQPGGRFVAVGPDTFGPIAATHEGREGSSLSGRATLQRAAYLDSLLRESGQGTGNGVLAELSRLSSSGGRVAEALYRQLLYSRAGAARDGSGLLATEVTRIADAVRAAWANGPKVVVLGSIDEAPDNVRALDSAARSKGAGKTEGFFHEGTVYLVADALPSAADVARVLAHETLGHYGLRGLFGDRLDGIVHQIVRARPVQIAAKLRDYGLANTTENRLDAAEEVLAEMAQTQPDIGFVRRAIAAIRRWLRSVGVDLKLTDADIIAQFIVPARRFVERGERAGSARVQPAFSRADDAFVSEVLAELAQHDDLFRYQVSQKATLDGVMAEVFPRAKYLGEDTREDERQESGADARHVFKTPEGKNLYVFERGKDVWMDVSRLEEGERGGGFYAAVMNYARNAGKRFIGDPAGLSEAAVVRRTSAMLSSALRFGTTEHLDAAPEQLKGIPEKGIAPLKWDGDDLSKVTSLIESFLSTLYTQFPALKGYRYDFRVHRFVDRSGRPVGVDRFADAARLGVARASRVGQATLRRGIFLQSLVSSESRARPELLENILARGRSLTSEGGPARAMFSRRASDSTAANESVLKRAQAALARVREARRHAGLGELSGEQEAALRNVGGIAAAKTLSERVHEIRANLKTKLVQGLVDQFAPLKDLDPRAYVLSRLSRGADGTLEAAMLFGKPFLNGGVADVKMDGGFAKTLSALEGEHDRFLWWVAAQRAERLKAIGLENLFGETDIAALKGLDRGTLASGKPRAAAFAQALDDLNAFNDAALGIAEKSGLIDAETRKMFKDSPYVPFYRVMDEDGGVRGIRGSNGLVNQRAWHKLKGGSQKLNNDLLSNLLMNWSHLFTASARNRAAVTALSAAHRAGVAQEVPAGTKGAVRVTEGGKQTYFTVDDPYLMQAISAIEYASPSWFKPFSAFKRWLTIGVTANPAFKVRNLIRDSLSAIGQAELSFNPLANVAQGWRASGKTTPTFASMLASGGIIRFGTMLEGDRSHAARSLIREAGHQVLDKAGWKRLGAMLGDAVEAYNELGDRSENANRAALYEQLRAKGYSMEDAAFAARDLLDFSMSGTWPVVRFLTQTVPFLNARMQGLYKLGRAAHENPRRFGYVAGAVSLASLALLLAYQDDDDWKAREDWDRDTYWWFKIGNTAFRIPKPFEIGAIGTLAERSWELAFDKEMSVRRYGARLSDMMANTFAMDPTPQIVKPIVDIWANKDSFTGRPIETSTLERLRPEDRYDERTTTIARTLGAMGLPNPASLAKGDYNPLSPKQIDFLIRGYAGWLGTTLATIPDYGLRPMQDRGDRPAMRLRDVFLAGNFVEALPAGSSRYVTAMYEQAREAEQAYASLRDALKRGDREGAEQIRIEEGEKLQMAGGFRAATQSVGKIGQRIKQIEADRKMSGDEKRAEITRLEQLRAQVARQAVERAAR